MKHWNTLSTAGRELLAKVYIKRGIFQGNSISPLLFVIFVMLLNQKPITVNSACILKIEKNLKHRLFMNGSKFLGEKKKEDNGLKLTVQISCQDIEIREFGIRNCVPMVEREKFVSSKGLDLTNCKNLRM